MLIFFIIVLNIIDLFFYDKNNNYFFITLRIIHGLITIIFIITHEDDCSKAINEFMNEEINMLNKGKDRLIKHGRTKLKSKGKNKQIKRKTTLEIKRKQLSINYETIMKSRVFIIISLCGKTFCFLRGLILRLVLDGLFT